VRSIKWCGLCAEQIRKTSRKTRQSERYVLKERGCVICGARFNPIFGPVITCSAECQKKRRRDRQIAFLKRRTPDVDAICDVCGKAFVRRGKSMVKRCSDTCISIARKKQVKAFHQTLGSKVKARQYKYNQYHFNPEYRLNYNRRNREYRIVSAKQHKIFQLLQAVNTIRKLQTNETTKNTNQH
jgi:hypothetical protein